jgi:hypothetical protein
MPKSSKSGGVTFSTNLSAVGNNTGIEVPPEVIQELGAGSRPAVSVYVNGYVYRNTVAVMGGKHLVSVSAAIRKETGLKGGDPITVTLTVETTPPTLPLRSRRVPALGPSSRNFRTVCSDITSTTSPRPRPTRPVNAESPSRSRCSTKASSADRSRHTWVCVSPPMEQGRPYGEAMSLPERLHCVRPGPGRTGSRLRF